MFKTKQKQKQNLKQINLFYIVVLSMCVLHASMHACVHAWTYTPPTCLPSPSLSFSPLHHPFSCTVLKYKVPLLRVPKSRAESSRTLSLLYSIYFPLLLLISIFILLFPFRFVFLADFYSDKLSLHCCRIYILLLVKSQKNYYFSFVRFL